MPAVRLASPPGRLQTSIGDAGEQELTSALRAGCLQPSGSELATEPPAVRATQLVRHVGAGALLIADGRAHTSACRTPPLPMQSRLRRSGAVTSTTRLVTLVRVIGTSPNQSRGDG